MLGGDHALRVAHLVVAGEVVPFAVELRGGDRVFSERL
jgi:hypothetical protein